MGKSAEKQDENFPISITGYRILLILMSLIEEGRTIEELVDILKGNSITNKSVSKDTVRITLNTLKKAGCQISRPIKSKGFKYELLANPFSLKLTDENLVTLVRLRETLVNKVPWKDVITINNLYHKLVELTGNQNQINFIDETKSLGNVNPDIIASFLNENIICKKIHLEYLSPEYGKEDIYVVPYKIIYENKRLYILCYSFKYNANCFLEVSRIIKIKSVYSKEKYPKENSYKVIYRISGQAMENYEKTYYETILKKANSYMDIEANVSNEFTFIQRILLYGADFTILSPYVFREKLIEKVKQIRGNYGV